jgi:hypothetical protein
MNAKDYYVLMENIYYENQVINEENLEIKKPLKKAYFDFKSRFVENKNKKTLSKIIDAIAKEKPNEKFNSEKTILISEINSIDRAVWNEISNLKLKENISKNFKELVNRIENIKINDTNTNLADCIFQVNVQINDILVKIKKAIDDYNMEIEEKKIEEI